MLGGTSTVTTVSLVALPAVFCPINEYVPWSPGYCGLLMVSVLVVVPEIVELPLGPGPSDKSTPLNCQRNVGTAARDTSLVIQ